MTINNDKNTGVRHTLILKFTEGEGNGKRFFIANRSINAMDPFYLNQRLVAWYEFDSPLKNANIFIPNKMEILMTLPYDNWNCRHQSIINKYKKQIIEHTHIIDGDEVMCNELFKNAMDEANRKLKSLYDTAYSSIYKLQDQYIYCIIKDLWYPKRSEYIYMKRYQLAHLLENLEPDTYEYNKVIVAMFLKNFLVKRDRCYVPFPKKCMWETIRNVIKENELGGKKKSKKKIKK